MWFTHRRRLYARSACRPCTPNGCRAVGVTAGRSRRYKQADMTRCPRRATRNGGQMLHAWTVESRQDHRRA